MPLYEYECQQCRRRTEKIQKFSDPELTSCPYCGGALERTLNAPAVHFSGGGWYKDLYSSPKPATGSGDASGPKPEAPPSGSGDNAPATGSSAPTVSNGSGAASPSTASPAPAAPASPTK